MVVSGVHLNVTYRAWARIVARGLGVILATTASLSVAASASAAATQRQFVTVVCDFGCGSEVEYFTRPGDWLWAIARDYLNSTHEEASPHAVKRLADSIYRRNPQAFRGSADRLRPNAYLVVAGEITSGGPLGALRL
jgi:Tfp pilus assembly protein FimV